MINLVRNELTKIFSKKAIYIYTTIVLILLVAGSLVSKNLIDNESSVSEAYIKSLEKGLNDYDLKDDNELKWYVGDRTEIETSKLSLKYKDDSPEIYYVDNVIGPLIKEKYTYEYIENNETMAKSIQEEIDKEIKSLYNFDWKKQLLLEKDDLIAGIDVVEQQLLEDKNDKELKNTLETLKIELWCIEYRLDNKIPYSYSVASSLVDTYKDAATQYLSNPKDESLIKDRNELIAKREVEKNYHTSLYRLEHKMYDDDVDYIVSNFTYVDGVIIFAIILICGSIISEEFNKGTIKQLLIKPYSRGKILASKFIACLIAVLAFIVVYESVFILTSCYDASNWSLLFSENVIYDFNLGVAKEVSVISQCLTGFVSVLPAYLIILTLVIFVGVLCTNTIAAMISGFGLYLGGDLIGMFLNDKVLSFVPFYTWDLSSYMYGGIVANTYASFGKSLIIDIVTILLLTILSFVLFKRKDIKNQ